LLAPSNKLLNKLMTRCITVVVLEATAQSPLYAVEMPSFVSHIVAVSIAKPILRRRTRDTIPMQAATPPRQLENRVRHVGVRGFESFEGLYDVSSVP
jgi:hypothetical protein